jgi:endonuclease/exonuclease/phosphatase family metal-dependent hydrolase
MSKRRIVAGALAGLALLPATAAAKSQGQPLTVMTRNIYLGGDIMRPLNATKGVSDAVATLVAFSNANYELREVVDKTSFPTRSKLLAREILTRKPDLVGLQEVATWRRGPFDVTAVLTGKKTATQVDYDFLKTLLKDLKGNYKAVVVREESDVEGPVSKASDPLSDPEAYNARLTMHDVILQRKKSKVKVLGKGSGQYKARYDINLSGATFSFIRGYGYVDAKLGSKRFRFINTHLESVSSTLALAQAKELVAGPVKKAGKKPVIVVCDCNSDPKLSVAKPDDIPHKVPYQYLTKNLRDEWLTIKPLRPGFTAGLSEGVNDPNAKAIDHRIDLVLARDAKGKALKAVKGWVTGTTARSKSGLWASDHAGVVVQLKP